MAEQASGQRDTTYMIMFSLFLKLLGFFVVMYTYADFEPSKVKVVEHSLQQTFNLSLHLPVNPATSGKHEISPWVAQNGGRAYNAIADELKTQIDFLSTEVDARRGVLVLDLPANIILAINGISPKNPGFTAALVETLRKNQPEGLVYKMQIVAKGGERDDMMRQIGDFVQTVVANDYSPTYLTIGYQDGQQEDPQVQFIIEAVPE